MDIKDIRRFRLRKLVLTRFGGKQSAFADAIGRSASYVARLFSSNPAHSRNIGESLARQIEQLCEVPTGFLDQPLTKAEELGAFDPATNPPTRIRKEVESLESDLTPTYPDHYEQVSLPVIDIPERLGLGHRMSEVEAVARLLTLDAVWLRSAVSMTDLSSLRIITGVGQSMAPTIKQGDLLIVDQSVTTVTYDAIYVICIGSSLTIKRIQRELDGIRVISDNPQYKEIQVPTDLEEKIEVLGRVVFIWSGSRA
ncbi:S24 family peptidase [Pseudomonas helleri]|uniref:S24 family peptidase n=1 Tax=Pseudomonas helleri TaxID=1608996 RepID=UPI003FD12FA0